MFDPVWSKLFIPAFVNKCSYLCFETLYPVVSVISALECTFKLRLFFMIKIFIVTVMCRMFSYTSGYNELIEGTGREGS